MVSSMVLGASERHQLPYQMCITGREITMCSQIYFLDEVIGGE
jgi:hypothetical protein